MKHIIRQLHTAKHTFDKLVKRAVAGRFRRKREPDFKRFLLEAPDCSLLDLKRSSDPARTVEL